MNKTDLIGAVVALLIGAVSVMAGDNSVEALRQEAFRQGVTVTDVEVHKEYDARKEYDAKMAGGGPTEFRACHILVKSKQEADAVLAELAKGAKFSELATRLSKDPGSKETGGDLGWFKLDQMVPEFSSSVAGLQNGQTAPVPVQTQFGWHVIQRLESRTPDPPAFEAVKEQVRNVLIAQKLQRLAASRQGITITDDDVRKQYDAEVANLAVFKARHILVKSQQECSAVVTRLTEGADFSKVAKELSIDPGSKEAGGELGWFKLDQMDPEFAKAVAGLQNGQIGRPVKSQFGWHIIQRQDLRASEPPAFDAVKEQIRSGLIAQKLQRLQMKSGK